MTPAWTVTTWDAYNEIEVREYDSLSAAETVFDALRKDCLYRKIVLGKVYRVATT